MTEASPAMLTVPETAQRLRCTEKTVRLYLREGTLQGVKVRGRWLIPATHINTITGETP